MALGADRRDVVMLVFRQGGMLIGAGVIVGLLAAGETGHADRPDGRAQGNVGEKTMSHTVTSAEPTVCFSEASAPLVVP